MTKSLVEANRRIRAHFSAASNEDGMEAAQVILILILVVVILIPVVRVIVNNLQTQGNRAGSSVLSVA